VVKHEARQHDVERAIRERQRLGVAAQELGPDPCCAELCAGLLEHPLIRIEPDEPRRRRVACHGAQELAGPATDLEHALPGDRADGAYLERAHAIAHPEEPTEAIVGRREKPEPRAGDEVMRGHSYSSLKRKRATAH